VSHRALVRALAILVFCPLALAAQDNKPASPAVKQVEDETASKLLKVRRIYVDSFGDDQVSKQLRDMVITSLAESKRFIVTENKEKADAILKGTGLEKTVEEYHATSEGTAVAGASGGQHSSTSGSISGGTGSISGSSRGGFSSSQAAISDAEASTKTIDHARLAVHMVSTDGDVIWTATKESKGAKYKGASADVADQIVKQLIWDLEKFEAKAK
jgi:hypothetical protein